MADREDPPAAGGHEAPGDAAEAPSGTGPASPPPPPPDPLANVFPEAPSGTGPVPPPPAPQPPAAAAPKPPAQSLPKKGRSRKLVTQLAGAAVEEWIEDVDVELETGSLRVDTTVEEGQIRSVDMRVVQEYYEKLIGNPLKALARTTVWRTAPGVCLPLPQL